MNRCRISAKIFWIIQLVFVVAFAAAYAGLSFEGKNQIRMTVSATELYPQIDVPREKGLVITPLYDDPSIATEEEVAAVLKQIRPNFPPKQLKPNYVEHALRTWGVDATFQDPDVMSGQEMVDYLVDNAKFAASWGKDVKPLLTDGPEGPVLRWGRELGASAHHDHWLACLTEAGISLNHPVYTATGKQMTIQDVLRQSMADFRYDERETDWSVMAFGLWLPPQKSWRTVDGRHISFDLLAKRMMRGHMKYGTCTGTHRVYSLMLLIRLDDEFDIISDRVREEAFHHLEHVRDLIVAAQHEDGHWPYDWWNGRKAITDPEEHPAYRRVIATGHLLEYLAIAPKELHPPHDRIVTAAKWIIKYTVERTHDEILDDYTFYSHVGAAMALWRNTTPGVFWRQWQATHPYQPAPAADEVQTAAVADTNSAVRNSD